MPNWVSNTLTVSGDAEGVKNFKEKAARAYFNRHGEEPELVQEPLSFMNFIAPPQEALDSGEYWGTHGFVKGEQVGYTSNNWYVFNNREWGTKWDASRVEIVWESAEDIQYGFDTAWSVPEPVFRAMVLQHPELRFAMHCIEEQGWGVEYEGGEGSLVITDEWDIPETHEDSMRRTESCVCDWAEDNDDLFDDCPEKQPEKVMDTEAAIGLLEEAESLMGKN